MVYLPTFTIKINQMQVNIPYMDPMGYQEDTTYILIKLPLDPSILTHICLYNASCIDFQVGNRTNKNTTWNSNMKHLVVFNFTEKLDGNRQTTKDINISHEEIEQESHELCQLDFEDLTSIKMNKHYLRCMEYHGINNFAPSQHSALRGWKPFPWKMRSLSLNPLRKPFPIKSGNSNLAISL